MIDKEKTIKKAIAKYNYLFPVRGKHSIGECFFSLRGETYLIFRTKKDKIRRVRAEYAKPPVVTDETGSREGIESIIKALNRPIIIRSLITRKPVNACLVNLFPVPGISWASKTLTVSDAGEHTNLTHSSALLPTLPRRNRLTEVPAVVKPSGTMAGYPMSGTEQRSYSRQSVALPLEYSTCHYEILATGYLPISQFTDMLPTPEETPGESTKTFHYEVLATGHLNKNPHREWQPVDNRGITCYLHEREPLAVEQQTDTPSLVPLLRAEPEPYPPVYENDQYGYGTSQSDTSGYYTPGNY
ncbi:MAG: hypothetical protein JW863_12485 [Chitinispirillaceae bacterium]|nr:hypothetical protein [Chitinispirillaceae bacterium]